ncbi:hypothetical protein [Xanthomonas arboricola]|nr:hypothetical protein [Xanthomonas arboricola]
MKLTFVDQGHSGKDPAAALEKGIELHVVTLQEAKKGVVLLSRR